MQLINGKRQNEIIAVNDNGNIRGKGYWNERIGSEIYVKDRYEYYLYFDELVADISAETMNMIVYELINRVREQHKKHPGFVGRVHTGCLTDDGRCIDYFSTIDGFIKDEGMHIISFDLLGKAVPEVPDNDYEVRENSFTTDKEIQYFIDVHTTIFRRGPYNVEAIRELMTNEGYKSISVYDNDQLIANIFLHVEDENGVRFGWLEDLFVVKGYRGKGLGEYLTAMGLEYFKSLELIESRLELWSANTRAANLYYKLGYEFMKETEVSIGMML